jgi:hypothetical protein
MSDLHQQIMNLPCKVPDVEADSKHHAIWASGYKHGHKDTRHAAAELAAAQSSRIARLEEALRQIVAIEDEMYGGDWDEIEKARSIARAALKGEA